MILWTLKNTALKTLILSMTKKNVYLKSILFKLLLLLPTNLCQFVENNGFTSGNEINK